MKDAAPLDSQAPLAVDEPLALPESVGCAVHSTCFEKSPTLRLLLIYLWQHRNEPISEYAIATDALGRNSLFNPKTDATVRVQISRLRQRLEKYYEHEGKDRPERLVIPLGSHQVQVNLIAQPDKKPAVLPPVEFRSRQAPVPAPVMLLAVLCLTLTMATVALAVLLYRTRFPQKPPGPQQEVARFWKGFFGNGRQSRIILPTPVFLSFSPKPGESIMFRDTTVNEFAAREKSTGFDALHKLMGEPQLAQSYTVTSDTFASVRLARYLDKAALVTRVLSSADAPLESLDNENVIAIGTWGTLTPLKPYLDRMSFRLGAHEQSVEISKPLADEPRKVEWVQESAERSIWPGVIAVLPGPGGKTHLLILCSRHTAALVSFLTSANGLEQLDRMWKARGSPEFYEVVVNSEMNGEDLVRFWPVALHPFSWRNTP
jgi:hypothetical protein